MEFDIGRDAIKSSSSRVGFIFHPPAGMFCTSCIASQSYHDTTSIQGPKTSELRKIRQNKSATTVRNLTLKNMLLSCYLK